MPESLVKGQSKKNYHNVAMLNRRLAIGRGLSAMAG